ncbi:unnamed protein product [Adineta ricciae]|uniref:Potassium channel domain-containing protein n=1 Tax=Adineta ricciae TaxID=249248 RepID=A0A814AQH4_ADIRI|nr:unnamed protein product [Adineta ricciae]CAF0916130.1 unnamed protein product [Adineta ricciae]
MSFSDAARSHSFNSCRSEFLCNIQSDETSLPTSTSLFLPNSKSTTNTLSSLKTSENQHNSQSNAKIKDTSNVMLDISRRLLKRKALFGHLSIISNIMCFLGLLGIVLMIMENEIRFLNKYENSIYLCWFIKLIITITTIILVLLVFYYHKVDLDLYGVSNAIDNWRIGLTARKIILIIVEVLICIIHPIPIELFSVSSMSPIYTNVTINATISDLVPLDNTQLNVLLGLPMFARLYLVCRFIMFHSHLVRDAFSQSLGSLNQVSLNFLFLLKTYLHLWPTRCVLFFCALLFIIGSWSLRVCSYRSSIEFMSMLDCMWLFIVTFTTVGYGDLTPANYCGRGVAAITALIGVLSTALLISVLSQKLEFSRSENYVHNFVVNLELTKARKNQAADVIKFFFKTWVLKRRHRMHTSTYLTAQRKLYRALHFSKQLKVEQKRLVDVCVGLPELITMQRQLSAKFQEYGATLATTTMKVEKIENRLVNIEQKLTNIQETLQSLLEKL